MADLNTYLDAHALRDVLINLDPAALRDETLMRLCVYLDMNPGLVPEETHLEYHTEYESRGGN